MIPAPRRGAAAVELALAFPMVCVLLLALMEWGRLFTQQATLVQIVHDAAGAGSRTPNATGPANVARARCLDALHDAGFDTAHASVTVTQQNASAGSILTVSLTIPFEPLGGIVPMPAALAASTTLRMQAS